LPTRNPQATHKRMAQQKSARPEPVPAIRSHQPPASVDPPPQYHWVPPL